MARSGLLANRKAWHLCGVHLFVPTLLATASLHILFSQVANAQTSNFTIAAKQTYRIGQQSVDGALAAFARTTGIQILNKGAVTQGKTSPGVNGTFTASEALSRLLAGTGLTPRFVNSNTVTVTSGATTDSVNAVPGAITLNTIEVQSGSGYPSDPYAGTINPPTTVGSKIPLSQREIPQTVSVITQQQIRERNIQSLDEAMRFTPGVTVLQSDADRVQYYSRGFPMTSMVIDGLPMVMNSDMSATASTNAPNLAMYERVEVLDGPAGLYGGFGSPGGVISLVRKRAPEKFTSSIDASVGTKNDYQGTIDIGGPLNADGSIRGRFVASGQTRDLDQESTWRRDQAYYGTIEADLTENTLLRVGGSYTRRDSNVGWANQIPLYTDFTLAGDRSSFYGAPWNHDRYTTTNLFASLEHRFDNDWKITAAGTYDYKTARVLSAEIFGNVDKETNEAEFGTTNTDYYERNQSYDLNATGKYELLGREHDLTFGANYTHLYNAGTTYYGTDSLFNFQTGNINNINFPLPTWSGLPAYTSKGVTEETQYGLYGNTRYHISDALTAIGGVRLSWWDTKFEPDAVFNPFGYSSSNGRYNAKTTPYAGLIYDFNKTYSAYFSYASIFQPQTLRDISGQLLKPMEGEQYEVGLKGSYLDGRLQTSIALFQLTQSNRAIATDATFQFYEAAGRARSRGVDIRISGEIRPDWTIMAGYTYTNSEYLDKDSIDGSASAFSQIAPEHLFKAWTNYQLPGQFERWQVGAGINATSSLYGGSGNEKITQKAFFTADARASYKFNDNVSLNLNATNIFDKKYFTPLTTYQGVVFGQGRRVSLSLNSKF